MQRLSDLSPSIIWVFLFFTLSLSSATRQFIWLMALVGLIIFARGPRDFLATDGVRKFWIVLACFLLPAIFSLFDAINFERSLSGAVRFLSYGFAVWVLLQIKLDRSESARLMSLVGAVMMLWVVDGLVQLLTGYSVFGNPLIELDSGDTLVTGSLRMGYGSTLAILSPFYLEALRRTGSTPLNSILALPLFAAIVMSGNEASMIHALAALAGYAFIHRALDEWRRHSWLGLDGGLDGKYQCPARFRTMASTSLCARGGGRYRYPRAFGLCAVFCLSGTATFRFAPRSCAELFGGHFGPVPPEQLSVLLLLLQRQHSVSDAGAVNSARPRYQAAAGVGSCQ